MIQREVHPSTLWLHIIRFKSEYERELIFNQQVYQVFEMFLSPSFKARWGSFCILSPYLMTLLIRSIETCPAECILLCRKPSANEHLFYCHSSKGLFSVRHFCPISYLMRWASSWDVSACIQGLFQLRFWLYGKCKTRFKRPKSLSNRIIPFSYSICTVIRWRVSAFIWSLCHV